MQDVETARRAMEESAASLDTAARPYFAGGRYGAWDAMARGEKLPAPVARAVDLHHVNAMAWARARGFA